MRFFDGFRGWYERGSHLNNSSEAVKKPPVSSHHFVTYITATMNLSLPQRLIVKLLYRANPHLTWRVRQATAHMTSRRTTHPRFTSTSPSLIASPLLTRLA